MRQTWVSLIFGAALGGLAVITLSSIFLVWNWHMLWDLPPLPTQIAWASPPPSTPAADAPLPPPQPTPVEINVPLAPTNGGPCGGPEQMTIALLGIDDRSNEYDQGVRTDAIVLANINLVNHTAALFSIPRDLYVPLPNLEYTDVAMSRINTAYLYGELYEVPGGGPGQFKDTVAWNFGIRVDRYIMVNFAAFINTVDAVGGIDVDVPDYIYDADFPADDGYGTMLFELPNGWQHLDGATALRYARTRHQDDDYHRIQRQQLVLMALRDKLLSPTVIPQLPALLNNMSTSIRTDLAPEEIAALLCASPQIDRSAIKTFAIDANMIIPWVTPQGGHVGIPDRDAIAPIVTEFLNP